MSYVVILMSFTTIFPSIDCELMPFIFLQEACLQGNLIAICLEQLSDPHPLLRQWLALCLARTWTKYSRAKWCGVRDSAHEKLQTLSNDPLPEVPYIFNIQM